LRQTAGSSAGAALVLPGHSQAITTLAFSAGTRWLSSGGEDGRILLWDLEGVTNGAEPVTLTGHDGAITALAFSPDERWLATSGLDHTVRLWQTRVGELIDVACRDAGRNLTPEEWRLYFRTGPYHQTCAQWPGPVQ
jgi:WD40 repeat protein